jgi:hypothetical protein
MVSAGQPESEGLQAGELSAVLRVAQGQVTAMRIRRPPRSQIRPTAVNKRSRSHLGSHARAGPSRTSICIQAVSSQTLSARHRSRALAGIGWMFPDKFHDFLRVRRCWRYGQTAISASQCGDWKSQRSHSVTAYTRRVIASLRATAIPRRISGIWTSCGVWETAILVRACGGATRRLPANSGLQSGGREASW